MVTLTRRIGVSPVEHVSKLIRDQKVINLASGSPDPETIPVELIANTFQDVLNEYGAGALAYPGAGGLEELRTALRKWIECLGVSTGGVEPVVTSGAQHAITLICMSELGASQYAHEEPTFVETLNSFRLSSRKGHAVPLDQKGMNVTALENMIKKGARPRLVYTIPTAHNPTGVNMSFERKRHLLELAETYDFMCLEDDPYRPICKVAGPSLFSLRQDRVIYVGTLSKALAPGLRIGFVLSASPELNSRLQEAEQLDFSTSTVNQLVAARMIDKGLIQSRLNSLKGHYALKLDALRESLEDEKIPLVYRPSAGFMALVRFKADAEALLRSAISKGVAYVPARSFYTYPSPKCSYYARLSVGSTPTAEVRKGVALLSKLLTSVRALRKMREGA